MINIRLHFLSFLKRRSRLNLKLRKGIIKKIINLKTNSILQCLQSWKIILINSTLMLLTLQTKKIQSHSLKRQVQDNLHLECHQLYLMIFLSHLNSSKQQKTLQKDLPLQHKHKIHSFSKCLPSLKTMNMKSKTMKMRKNKNLPLLKKSLLSQTLSKNKIIA